VNGSVHRRWGVCALLAALLLLAAPGARAQCALSLVLAVDVSSSVDRRDYALQMTGLANALRDETVRAAITQLGGIQVTAFEWSGRRQQVEIVPWSFVAGDADVFALADRIETHRRVHSAFPTALGYALGHAARLMAAAPLSCTRQVVDVSGDGVNNEGFAPALANRSDGLVMPAAVAQAAYEQERPGEDAACRIGDDRVLARMGPRGG